jgi:tight adherence protein B
LLTKSLILAVVTALLFGGVLIVLFYSEQRRKVMQQRLGTMSAAARRDSQAGGAASLRRAQPKDSVRGRTLPRMLRERLDAAYAATGDAIGPVHSAAVGLLVGGISLVACIGVMDLSPLLTALITIAVAVAAMNMLVKSAQARYQRKFLELFPDALDLIVRAVKAGLPVLDAMAIIAREIPAPVGTEYQKILDEMHIGVDMGAALQRTADRIRIPDFRFFVVSLSLQRRTGGGLAETLGNLSFVIRRRKELRVKARALSAEAKTTAIVLGVLPFVGGIGMFSMNHALMMPLIFDPRGRFMLGLGIGSMLLGIIVINMMIKKALK